MAFLVIKDETPYNGEVSFLGVYRSEDTAQAVADYEREKAEDWVNSMRESGEKVGDWVPEMSVVSVTLEGE